jgi:hypothetical protein
LVSVAEGQIMGAMATLAWHDAGFAAVLGMPTTSVGMAPAFRNKK